MRSALGESTHWRSAALLLDKVGLNDTEPEAGAVMDTRYLLRAPFEAARPQGRSGVLIKTKSSSLLQELLLGNTALYVAPLLEPTEHFRPESVHAVTRLSTRALRIVDLDTRFVPCAEAKSRARCFVVTDGASNDRGVGVLNLHRSDEREAHSSIAVDRLVVDLDAVEVDARIVIIHVPEAERDGPNALGAVATDKCACRGRSLSTDRTPIHTQV
jgi:hypothetical protein